jgi:hypothetical protein
MALPIPTIGKVGFTIAMRFPSASVRYAPSGSDSCLFACLNVCKYTTMEMIPDKRNNMPMATVIQVTVLPGYLTSIMPIAIAQMERKTELCNIFISVVIFGFTVQI